MQVTRKVVFIAQFIRSYASKYPRPRPGTSERPPYKVPDPLTNSSNATTTALEDNQLTFIHRPPPSAPTPHSLSTAPSSPLLWAKPTIHEGPLPPLIRPTTDKPEVERVSSEVVEKIRELRRLNPTENSRNKLAKMFGVTSNFVAGVAALKKPQRVRFIRQREQEHAAIRGEWGEKKATHRAIRQKRRTYW